MLQSICSTNTRGKLKLISWEATRQQSSQRDVGHVRSRGNALQKGLSVRTELVKQLLDAHKVPVLAADFIRYLEGNLKNRVLPEIKMHLVYDLAIQNSNSFQRVKEKSGIVYRGFSNL